MNNEKVSIQNVQHMIKEILSLIEAFVNQVNVNLNMLWIAIPFSHHMYVQILLINVIKVWLKHLIYCVLEFLNVYSFQEISSMFIGKGYFFSSLYFF